MRTLTFQQISDARFNGSESQLKQLTDGVLSVLSTLPDVKVQVEESRTLTFPDSSDKSYRQRFYVQKTGRSTTWNDIYKAVNSIKAIKYDFVCKYTFH